MYPNNPPSGLLPLTDSEGDYQSPEEKPPGGMRFLLITWFVPFNEGTVVLISGLNPSPVIGLPLLPAKETEGN